MGTALNIGNKYTITNNSSGGAKITYSEDFIGGLTAHGITCNGGLTATGTVEGSVLKSTGDCDISTNLGVGTTANSSAGTLYVKNTAGAGAGGYFDTLGAKLACFEGSSNSKLMINEHYNGDFAIYNQPVSGDKFKNGISFYNGTGGVKIFYNGHSGSASPTFHMGDANICKITGNGLHYDTTYVLTVENTGDTEYADGINIIAGGTTNSNVTNNTDFIRFANGAGSGKAWIMGVAGASAEIRFSGKASATYSDIRNKENIVPVTSGSFGERFGSPLGFLQECDLFEFTYKAWDQHSEELKEEKRKSPQIGMSAQQLEKLLPYIVHPDNPEKMKEEGMKMGDDGYLWKEIDYKLIVPILMQGMKDQQKQIENLELRIEKLENK